MENSEVLLTSCELDFPTDPDWGLLSIRTPMFPIDITTIFSYIVVSSLSRPKTHRTNIAALSIVSKLCQKQK